ncbi:YcjF family protein [Myroides sp. LJL115]
MNSNTKLYKAAFNLLIAIDSSASKILPEKLVGIVKTHAVFAVGAAFIPIPGVDIVASGAAIWGMYLNINKTLGIKLKENIVKTIVSGVATNLLGYAAGVALGSVFKLIPGIGTIAGMALMAGTLYAVTLASGYVYFKALTLLAQKHNGRFDFSADEVKSEVNDFMKNNKESIKDIIKEGKTEYSKNKDSIKPTKEQEREFEKEMERYKNS